MSATPKVNALLTARSSRAEYEDTTLRRIFRRTRAGLKAMAVFVELSELAVGRPISLKVRLVNAVDEETWQEMDDESVVRWPIQSWRFR